MQSINLLSLILILISCNPSNSDQQQKESGPAVSSQVVLVSKTAQQKPIALKDIIPPGYTIVQTKEGPDQIKGDLNGDGQEDLAVLIEMQGDENYDHSEEVLLMIYSADRHGQLQLASATKNLGGASVAYDDTKKLSLRKNVLCYHHQSMRHHIDVKYRYDQSVGNFVLIGKDFADYGSIESGPRHISINYLTGVKLINESIWNDETEETEALPERKEKVSKQIREMDLMDWDSLYDDI